MCVYVERERETEKERDGRVLGTVRVWSRIRVRERRTGYLSICPMAFWPVFRFLAFCPVFHFLAFCPLAFCPLAFFPLAFFPLVFCPLAFCPGFVQLYVRV